MKKFFYLMFIITIFSITYRASYSQESKPHITTLKSTGKSYLYLYPHNIGYLNLIDDINFESGPNLLQYLYLPNSIKVDSIDLAILSDAKYNILEKKYIDKGFNFTSDFKNKLVKIMPLKDLTSLSGVFISDNFILNENDLYEIMPNSKLVYVFKSKIIDPIYFENNFRNYCSFLVNCKSDFKSKTNLSFKFDGVSSSFTHNVLLNSQTKLLQFDTLANIKNNTNYDFTSCDTNILTGDLINDEPSSYIRSLASPAPSGSIFKSSSYRESNVEAKSVSNLYRYHLNDELNLKAKESKSVNLAKYSDIPYDKYSKFSDDVDSYSEYYKNYDDYQNTEYYLEFVNSKNSLNTVIPAGIVNVYELHPNRTKLFLGSKSIDNISVNQKFKIDLGESYDVKIKKKLLDYKSNHSSNNLVVTKSLEYKIYNFAEQTNHLIFNIYSNSKNLEIIESNYDYTKNASQDYSFDFKLNPHDELSLKLKVKIKN